MFRGKYRDTVPTSASSELSSSSPKDSKIKKLPTEIGTTEHVIKNYLRTIYDKLGLWNRVELALWYEARRHEGTDFGRSN